MTDETDDYTLNIFENITFMSLEEATEFVHEPTVLERIDTLGVGEGNLHEGAIVIYSLNQKDWLSGLVMANYIDEKDIAHIIVKRCGVCELHDVLSVGGEFADIAMFFDSIEKTTHSASNVELNMMQIFEALTYGSANTIGRTMEMVEEINAIPSDDVTPKTLH